MLRPTELHNENLPPTQSFIGKIFSFDMPKELAFSKLVETAINCLLNVLSGACFKNHFLKVYALLSVSSVVKLLETIIKGFFWINFLNYLFNMISLNVGYKGDS